jgi:transcriptional regulator of acetoin/glycerol metabolism
MRGPAPWFFATTDQRLQWARQRYFDEGHPPNGLVPDTVVQSWARCLHGRQEPQRVPVFNPVNASRVHAVLARNRSLLHAAGEVMQQLQRTLAGTPAVALLLDADGVVMHTSRQPDASRTPVLAQAARLGVDLSEARIGTNAPALALQSEGPCLVRGAEHFANALQTVHCAAVALRQPDGRVAAVLNLSTEGQPFGFNAGMVVALHATAIENRMLLADTGVQLVLHLQLQPARFGDGVVGLVGVDALGRLAWLNAAAQAMLGPVPLGSLAEQALGLGLSVLQHQARRGTLQRVRLNNGLQLWLQGEWRGNEAPQAPLPAPQSAPIPLPLTPAQPASSLRDTHRNLVLRTLRACGGNVSAAARELGVSRGLIYRHRQRSGQ